MIKAIVSSKAELDALPQGVGYQPTFEEGDEAIGGGIRLIFINGSWQDKGEYDERVAAAEKARASTKQGGEQ